MSTVVSIRYERSVLFRCFVCSLVLSLEDVQRKNGLEQRVKNDKVETKGKEEKVIIQHILSLSEGGLT